MSKGFVLHIWGPGRSDKLKKAYAPDLTAADLRPLVEDMDPSDPYPNDPDMTETLYVGRPGCEAEIARLFNVEAIKGRYDIGSARWQRPEPDEVLDQQWADYIKGKKRVEGFSVNAFHGEDHVLGARSATISAAESMPYLEDVWDNDPGLKDGEYSVRPGSETAVAALFGATAVPGDYSVGATYWYE